MTRSTLDVDDGEAKRLKGIIKFRHRQLYAFNPGYREAIDRLREEGEIQVDSGDSFATAITETYKCAYRISRRNLLKCVGSVLVAYGVATQFDYGLVDETIAAAALIYAAMEACFSIRNFSSGRDMQKRLEFAQRIIDSKEE